MYIEGNVNEHNVKCKKNKKNLSEKVKKGHQIVTTKLKKLT